MSAAQDRQARRSFTAPSSCPSAGSSNAPSHGSAAIPASHATSSVTPAEPLPSCASPWSASCSGAPYWKSRPCGLPSYFPTLRTPPNVDSYLAPSPQRMTATPLAYNRRAWRNALPVSLCGLGRVLIKPPPPRHLPVRKASKSGSQCK
jgi:hypothetical protein